VDSDCLSDNFLQLSAFRSNHPKNVKSLSFRNISDRFNRKIMAGFDSTADAGSDLILRLLREEDAEELSLRVDENREHLRRWMPWLDGAEDISDQLKFIQRCSEGAAAEKAFHYAILLDGEIVGMISFAVFRSSMVARQWDIDSPIHKLEEG
jgi:RimJ/RimL family protein N-acetyltransferase